MNFRHVFFAVLIFLMAVSIPLFAQDAQNPEKITENTTEEEPEQKKAITLRSQTGLALSTGSALLSPDIAVLYRPSFWGIGAGVKGYAGLTLGDAYIVPYATAELGWFSADLGFSLRLRESNINSASYDGDDLPLYISAGLHPSFKLGPGKFMLGASLDLSITDVPVVESEDALESFFATLIVAIFSIFKFEGDIGYRISL